MYVTFAMQNAERHDDVKGPGNGFIDVFDLNGSFLERFATGGALNSPWAQGSPKSVVAQLGVDVEKVIASSKDPWKPVLVF